MARKEAKKSEVVYPKSILEMDCLNRAYFDDSHMAQKILRERGADFVGSWLYGAKDNGTMPRLLIRQADNSYKEYRGLATILDAVPVPQVVESPKGRFRLGLDKVMQLAAKISFRDVLPSNSKETAAH